MVVIKEIGRKVFPNGSSAIQESGSLTNGNKPSFESILKNALVNTASTPPVTNDLNFNPTIAAPTMRKNIVSKLEKDMRISEDSPLLAQNILTEEDLEQIEMEDELFQYDDQQNNRDFPSINSSNINESMKANHPSATPFHIFLDKSVDVLENISKLDFKVNDLVEKFIDGKSSLDEVSVEMSKLNLAISFATTLLTTISQTFKELTQMAV